jgi:hypothetical protein
VHTRVWAKLQIEKKKCLSCILHGNLLQINVCIGSATRALDVVTEIAWFCDGGNPAASWSSGRNMPQNTHVVK